MGLFLVATAVRDVAVKDVAVEIQSWCSDHFVVCSDDTGHDKVPSAGRIDVFAPINDWTTVLWPGFFLACIEVAEHLSAKLGAVVSAVNVYDSDCWQQVTVDGGRIVDRYATDPRYLTTELEPLRVIAPLWRGDPNAVAALLGCSAPDVGGHYRRNRGGRAFDDWGFVALWADQGITYPGPSATLGATLTLAEDWFDVLNRVSGN